MFPEIFMIPQRYGPGIRNYFKGVRGRWSTANYRTREGELVIGPYGHPLTAQTFTSVPTGTHPHQSTREINRRLRQAQKKAA